MRLIDADKIMEELTGCFYDTTDPAARRATHDTMALCQKLIEEQPAAYDVDKVVEQIKSLSPANYVEKNKVLEIVKAGGVNE